MRISQDIRDYAKKNDLSEAEAINKGLKEKAKEFVDTGSNLYQ